MDGVTITEFILARVAEDEEVARFAYPPPWVQHDAFVYIGQADDVTEDDEPSFYVNGGTYAGQRRTATHAARHDPARVLAECEAKRRIVELHKSWPVLVQQQPTFEDMGGDLSTVTYRMSQRMAWFTNQQYRDTFGDEPPTAPMLAAMATVYADHPDYREEWRP